jgi:hypothetical protein
MLRLRAGEPVAYADLQSAGIEFPGSVVTELELAGVQIDRCEAPGPAGRTVRAVRLPEAAADAAWRPATDAGDESGVPPDPSGRDWDDVRVYRGSLWLTLETAWAELRHREGLALLAGRARSVGLRRPTSRILLPVAVLVALAATAAVVVTGISGGKADRRSITYDHPGTATSADAVPTRSAAQRQKASASAPAHSPQGSAAASTRGSRSSLSVAPSSRSGPGATTGAAARSTEYRADTPSAAVQAFYEAAAQHRYGSAWALADANMRNQLEGYAAFADQMRSVRSITFHRAEMLGGSGTGVARVRVQTTSVQRTRMRECGGSVRTVRSTAGWQLDGISISCS